MFYLPLGLNSIARDVKFMLKTNVSFYWRLCWGIFTPIILIIILIYSLINIEPLKYKGKLYPTSAYGRYFNKLTIKKSSFTLLVLSLYFLTRTWLAKKKFTVQLSVDEIFVFRNKLEVCLIRHNFIIGKMCRYLSVFFFLIGLWSLKHFMKKIM